MKKEFNKGLLLAGLGSFWWGFLGVLYFKYIDYIGHIELVVHRCLWTTFTLIITTFFFSKWHIFLETDFFLKIDCIDNKYKKIDTQQQTNHYVKW